MTHRRFHMPAEARPHERTFMQWPSNTTLYHRDELHGVQRAIVSIANAIAEHEPVVTAYGSGAVDALISQDPTDPSHHSQRRADRPAA